MKGRGSSDREAYWRRVMREQKSSRLSIAAFCRQRGISAASFYNWRSKLRQQDEEPHQQAAVLKAAKFVPVDVPSTASSQQRGFEVVLANGRRLCVPPSFHKQTLCELLEVLEQLPC